VQNSHNTCKSIHIKYKSLSFNLFFLNNTLLCPYKFLFSAVNEVQWHSKDSRTMSKFNASITTQQSKFSVKLETLTISYINSESNNVQFLMCLWILKNKNYTFSNNQKNKFPLSNKYQICKNNTLVFLEIKQNLKEKKGHIRIFLLLSWKILHFNINLIVIGGHRSWWNIPYLYIFSTPNMRDIQKE
jgi:hypothetical protein